MSQHRERNMYTYLVFKKLLRHEILFTSYIMLLIGIGGHSASVSGLIPAKVHGAKISEHNHF